MYFGLPTQESRVKRLPLPSHDTSGSLSIKKTRVVVSLVAEGEGGVNISF